MKFVRQEFLGIEFTLTDLEGACRMITGSTSLSSGAYFCISNTHQLVLSLENPSLTGALNNAHGVIPDSTVLLRTISCLESVGGSFSSFRGYDLFKRLLDDKHSQSLKIGVIGGDPSKPTLLRQQILKHNPNVKIVYEYYIHREL